MDTIGWTLLLDKVFGYLRLENRMRAPALRRVLAAPTLVTTMVAVSPVGSKVDPSLTVTTAAMRVALSYCIAVCAFAQAPPSNAYKETTGGPTSGLQESAARLQQALSDDEEQRVRENVVDACLRLPAMPTISEEARRYFVRGASRAKLSKTKQDFAGAASEYHEGLKLAPCAADGYFNYALVLELADQVRPAINAFSLYLRAAPNAPDATKVRTKIYELEVKLQSQSPSRSALRTGPAVPGGLHVPFAPGSPDAKSIEAAVEELRGRHSTMLNSSNFFLLYEPGRVPATVVWDMPFAPGSKESLQARQLVEAINARGGLAGRKLSINETGR